LQNVLPLFVALLFSLARITPSFISGSSNSKAGFRKNQKRDCRVSRWRSFLATTMKLSAWNDNEKTKKSKREVAEKKAQKNNSKNLEHILFSHYTIEI